MAVNQIDIEVGRRISQLVEANNVAARQVALAIGMDPSQFAKILKGTAAISLEKLVDISSKYNVDIKWLLTGRGAMEAEPLEERSKDIRYIKVANDEAVLVIPQIEIGKLKESITILQRALSKIN